MLILHERCGPRSVSDLGTDQNALAEPASLALGQSSGLTTTPPPFKINNTGHSCPRSSPVLHSWRPKRPCTNCSKNENSQLIHPLPGIPANKVSMSGRALCGIQMKGIPHLRVHLLVPASRQARLLPTRTLPWENGRESVSEVDGEDLPLECICRMYLAYARCRTEPRPKWCRWT